MSIEKKLLNRYPNSECKVFEDTTFDLVYQKYTCNNRKGNPNFKCQYLESNIFIIKHFCMYRNKDSK